MSTPEELAARCGSGDVEAWRSAIADTFSIADDIAREEALRAIRPVYVKRLSPQFAAVPWGPTLWEQEAFREAYRVAKQLTQGFTSVGENDLVAAMEAEPRTMLVFRMILGYTTQELAAALELLEVDVSKGVLDSIERGRGSLTASRRATIRAVAQAVRRVIAGELFALDDGLPLGDFKSRMDKFDTEAGWKSVADAAKRGVDYGDYLYERYIDGPWLQARSAYSEKKGHLIEDAVSELLDDAGIPYDKNPEALVANGTLPSRPDFVLPHVDHPTVTIEAKGADDGGTARDKAARIAQVATAARAAGMVPIAVIDGIGFRRRDALVHTLEATQGLTFSLSNIDLLLTVPEIAALEGRGVSA